MPTSMMFTIDETVLLLVCGPKQYTTSITARLLQADGVTYLQRKPARQGHCTAITSPPFLLITIRHDASCQVSLLPRA